MFDLRHVEFEGKKAVFNFHLLKVRKQKSFSQPTWNQDVKCPHTSRLGFSVQLALVWYGNLEPPVHKHREWTFLVLDVSFYRASTMEKYSLIFLKSTFFSVGEGTNVILRFRVRTHWPFCKNNKHNRLVILLSLAISKINHSVYLEVSTYFKAEYIMTSSWNNVSLWKPISALLLKNEWNWALIKQYIFCYIKLSDISHNYELRSQNYDKKSQLIGFFHIYVIIMIFFYWQLRFFYLSYFDFLSHVMSCHLVSLTGGD